MGPHPYGKHFSTDKFLHDKETNPWQPKIQTMPTIEEIRQNSSSSSSSSSSFLHQRPDTDQENINFLNINQDLFFNEHFSTECKTKSTKRAKLVIPYTKMMDNDYDMMA
jgi:hypothetical protein